MSTRDGSIPGEAFIFGGMTPTEIRDQLDRILTSRSFRNSTRLQGLLRFAVECTLKGDTEQLKEPVLAQKVFARGSDTGARSSSTVRLELQRLRRRLREYYDIEGGLDPVVITFPFGCCVPSFDHASHDQPLFEPLGPGRLDSSTVAVLPFRNFSPEEDQDYFCDGITEDIIHALSSIAGLKVIGRTSSFTFRNSALDPRAIGLRLGAGTLLGGSVRKLGPRLKISAEMINAEHGQVEWSEVFDTPLGDIFTVQEEIAQSISSILQVRLSPGRVGKLARGAPDVDAYLLYLKARQAWNLMNVESYRSAIRLFENAVGLYPAYAAPYAGLADAYIYLALWGGAKPREVFPEAKHAAREALRLDPNAAHAYASLAAVTLFNDWRWGESVELAKQGMDLEPCYGFGQHVLGACLLAGGQHQEALACFETAVHLDPLSLRANRSLGWAHYMLRQYQSAERWLRAAIVLDSNSVETRYVLGSLFLCQGRLQDAWDQALHCQKRPPDPHALALTGACHARLGHKEAALGAISELSDISAAGYIDPHCIGQIYLGLEDYDRALDSVHRSVFEHTPAAAFLNLDPQFDALHADPGFAALAAPLRR